MIVINPFFNGGYLIV